MQAVNIDLEHRNYDVATATAISYGTSSGVAKDTLLNETIATTTWKDSSREGGSVGIDLPSNKK